MNSLKVSFAFSLPHTFLAALLKRHALLFICLLCFTQGALRAQETAQVSPAAAEVRAGTSAAGTITGRVVSDDGRPLADTLIYLTRAYASVPGPPQTATTDADGRFRVSGLGSGLYSVSAVLPGFIIPDATNNEVSEANFYRIGDSVNLTLAKGGVITGTVRDASGEPVVAVGVRAMRLRDAAGRTPSARFSGFFPERMTDDRGVYRIYGLAPGTYVVSAGGSQRIMSMTNGYDGDAPTFFPSSTRDTAAEVPVRGGEETTSIDIRYRGERGHTISGTVSGFIETKAPAGVSITLRQIPGGGYEGATFVMPGAKPGYDFNGISDGEYEVMAQQWGGASDSAVSLPRRVTIKGADITGIDLILAPLASITGRVQLEAPPAKEICADGRSGTLLETAIQVRRDAKSHPEDTSRPPVFSMGGGIPTDQGEFTIRNLIAGNYRLSVRLPNEAWYVRSIILPGAPPPPTTAPAKSAQAVKSAPASNLIALKAGTRATNVNVQIAQDAAGVRGRVTSETEGAEGAQLPINLKVYLVPVERERAEDVLRYSEAQLASDGTFALQNLAPGRYWIIARPAPESETPERTSRPLAWDADKRARLRQEAEAVNTTIELKSCQRASDYVLRYASNPPAAKP